MADEAKQALRCRKATLQAELVALQAVKEEIATRIDIVKAAIDNCNYLLTLSGLPVFDIVPEGSQMT